MEIEICFYVILKSHYKELDIKSQKSQIRLGFLRHMSMNKFGRFMLHQVNKKFDKSFSFSLHMFVDQKVKTFI